MDFQEPAYDLYELNPVWTLKNIAFMLAGPRPLDREPAINQPWAKWRDLVRNALIGAYKTDGLIPINKDEVEEELRINKSGNVVPVWEVNIYEIAEYKRGDVVAWMEKERIMDILHGQGHQVPSETIELIEKIKRVDQIKLPDSKTDNLGRSMDSLEGIFPAPEGTRWQDVRFTIKEKGPLEIKVKGKERTLHLKEIKKYFPQEQQRELLFMIIWQPGGVFDKEICKKVKGKAFQNSRHIISDLRISLKDLFEITGDPIKWIPKKKSYEAQFSVHSEWDTPANSNLD